MLDLSNHKWIGVLCWYKQILCNYWLWFIQLYKAWGFVDYDKLKLGLNFFVIWTKISKTIWIGINIHFGGRQFCCNFKVKLKNSFPCGFFLFGSSVSCLQFGIKCDLIVTIDIILHRQTIFINEFLYYLTFFVVKCIVFVTYEMKLIHFYFCLTHNS